MARLFYLLLPVLFVFTACDPDNNVDDDPVVDFDRKAMLTDWLDNVIVPAYADFSLALANLKDNTTAFTQSPSPETRADVQSAYREAYLAFQSLDPVLIGLAEQIRMRDQLNTYPADTELIEENVVSTDINLELPSNTAAQGFPTLDYLLFGLTEEDLLAGTKATAYQNYLLRVVDRMQQLTLTAADYWTPEVRQAFIDNDGNSATASIDRTVNDFIFYYEKFLRAGKVGIPAGVFSDDPLADRAEALYSGISPVLFSTALNASQNFFENHGLADYLDALSVERDGEQLSTQIIRQFNAARTKANTIQLNFSAQVETDNVQMLELYNELQRNVVLLKVDMLQALSINVDYVDADGD